MIEMPVIDISICTGCGLCVSACYCGAITLCQGKVVIVETTACGWCTVCEAVCPLGAISCAYEIVIE